MLRRKPGSSMSPAELEAVRRPSFPCRKVSAKGCSAVAYVWEHVPGKWSAIMYAGKRSKPDSHYYYRSELAREKAVADHFAAVAAIEGREKARKAPHKLEVGHILVASWGYDQTNVDYFEVVEVPGPYSVKVRPIKCLMLEARSHDSSSVMPAPGEFKGEAQLCRAYAGSAVRINESVRAYLWDMKPDLCSWGH